MSQERDIVLAAMHERQPPGADLPDQSGLFDLELAAVPFDPAQPVQDLGIGQRVERPANRCAHVIDYIPSMEDPQLRIGDYISRFATNTWVEQPATVSRQRDATWMS